MKLLLLGMPQDIEEFEKEIESLRESSNTEVQGTQFSIFPEEEE